RSRGTGSRRRSSPTEASGSCSRTATPGIRTGSTPRARPTASSSGASCWRRERWRRRRSRSCRSPTWRRGRPHAAEVAGHLLTPPCVQVPDRIVRNLYQPGGAMATTTANDGWRQTACILCYVNCGLEVATEGRAIARVRGDRANGRSRGYLCQKPQRLGFYGNHADRLTTPLRRRSDGTHEPVGWDVAFREIAARVRELRDAHGSDAFAFYGGGGQGNHLGGAYFTAFRDALGATKYFNALSQEKTGDFWVNGRLFGKQHCHTAEDIEHADLLVVLGCNPWMANGFQRARNAVNEIGKAPDRRMIVIDPRRTEVAEAADLHLQLKPGTDAYLLSALLAVLLGRGG